MNGIPKAIMARRAILLVAVLSIAALCISNSSAAPEPARSSEAAKKTTSATNAAPVEVPIPKAVFSYTAAGAKDPFFPLSTRLAVTTSTNIVAPTFGVNAFQLKGLSGTANNRLAVINNRILAVGEEAEVFTTNGRVRIKCLAIGETSATIKVDKQSAPIELHFRKDF